jgi:Fe-S-cluster containining protein
MADLSHVECDGKNRKIVFHGSCFDLLPVCEAMCCREWDVNLSLAEYESGLYQIEEICLLTAGECTKEKNHCIDRIYRLKKKEDGSCLFLDDNNKCGIYENRPGVCRKFSCRRGWHLSPLAPADSVKESNAILGKEKFIERMRDDLVFIVQPLLRMASLIYLEERGEILFIKERVGKCKKIYTKDKYRNPKLKEEHLLCLLDLFRGKETLQDTYDHFCRQHQVSLEKTEFYEIVWLLNNHGMVLDSRNFYGMLGVGRIY